MTTKTITIRIPADMYDGYARRAAEPDGESINASMVADLHKSATLQRLSLEELRGRFSVEEWSALADIFNTTRVMPEFRYRSDYLIAEVEDAAIYEDIESRWGIDIAALNNKCRALTAAQLDALYTRIEYFWAHPNANIKEWADF